MTSATAGEGSDTILAGEGANTVLGDVEYDTGETAEAQSILTIHGVNLKAIYTYDNNTTASNRHTIRLDSFAVNQAAQHQQRSLGLVTLGNYRSTHRRKWYCDRLTNRASRANGLNQHRYRY